MRQEKTNIIGLAVGVRQRPHINNLVVAAHDECLKRGYQPALFEPAHLMPQQGFSPFPSVEMLAGLLSIDLSMERTLPEFYASLRETLPIVALYEVASPIVASAATDWQVEMNIAVEHLLQLGHRRIAYAHDSRVPYPSDRKRRHAWQKCVQHFAPQMKECHVALSYPAEFIRCGGIFADATHMVSIAEQIVAKLRAMKNPPTALLCPGDEIALAVQGRLLGAGWKLPEQLSIIGFDGIDFGEYSQPTLTTVAQNVDGMAAAAFDLLLHGAKTLEAGQTPSCKKRHIAPRLVVRDSTTAVATRTREKIHATSTP